MADQGRACDFCSNTSGRGRPPARYRVELPLGNVIELCVECCAFVRQDAAQNPHDRWAQPVRITEIEEVLP